MAAPDYERLGPFQVAQLLAALARREEVDLVLLGKQVSPPRRLAACTEPWGWGYEP